MNSSLNSFSHSIFTPPQCPSNHQERAIITSAFRRHLRRRPHRHHRHKQEKPISVNPNSPQSDSNKFQLVIDLPDYFSSKNTPISFQRLLATSQFKFNQFVQSSGDAFDDLGTLVSYDNDKRVVISCEKSTLYFLGNLALLGFVIVVSFRVVMKLGLGFRDLFRYKEESGGVVMRRDRSLGGKLVAVGKREEMNRDISRGSMNPLSSDEEILEGGSDTLIRDRSMKSVTKKLPTWWPVSHAPPSLEVNKEVYQLRANRLLQAITDNKLIGKDVTWEDIILLRRICRESGVRVFFDATNSRDSFYRASVDFLLNIRSRMISKTTFIQIDGEDAREFITGLAENIGLEKIRAARMVAAAVAARTQSRLLQAWALEMQDNHSEAVMELLELCFIHHTFPPEEGSPEMEMVARGLANHLKLEQRKYLLEMVTEVCFEESCRSLAEALGLGIPMETHDDQENKLS